MGFKEEEVSYMLLRYAEGCLPTHSPACIGGESEAQESCIPLLTRCADNVNSSISQITPLIWPPLKVLYLPGTRPVLVKGLFQQLISTLEIFGVYEFIISPMPSPCA
jgi:hypothetical protein